MPAVMLLISLLLSSATSTPPHHAPPLAPRGSCSGSGPAQQLCGTEGFYCPTESNTTDRCKPREQRCAGEYGSEGGTCPGNGEEEEEEEGCFQSSSEGEYEIRLGHSKLGCFGFKKTILEHRFVTYRGFTYEFGSYSVQILDINDPDYKYINGRYLNSGGIESVGTSYCTQEDADQFAESWRNKSYNLFIRNCQHFAKAMIVALTETSCNQPPSRRRRRKRRGQGGSREEIFEMEIERILTNCSIVCCDAEDSALVTTPTSLWLSMLSILIIHWCS